MYSKMYLRQWLPITGDICSGNPPKVFEIDMAQGQDMPKGPEPGTSGLEITTAPGELEFSSRSNQKKIKKLHMFFQLDLEKNSSLPGGDVFS